MCGQKGDEEMCMVVDEKETAKMRERWKRRKEIRVWKVLAKRPLGLESLFHYEQKWRPGMMDSGREGIESRGVDEFDSMWRRLVRKGFHVFLVKDEASAAAALLGPQALVVELIASPKDFVAAGQGMYPAGQKREAVFTRLRLRKKEYERVMKEKVE